MPYTSVPVISWTSLNIIIKFFLELDLTLTNYLPIVFKNVQIMPLSTMAINRQNSKAYPTSHRATMVFNSKFLEKLRKVQSLILLKRITVRISYLHEPTSEFHTHSKSSTTENSLLYRAISWIFIYLPAFLDTVLPRGNVHERDSGLMLACVQTSPISFVARGKGTSAQRRR